jgi:hypothetical protein
MCAGAAAGEKQQPRPATLLAWHTELIHGCQHQQPMLPGSRGASQSRLRLPMPRLKHAAPGHIMHQCVMPCCNSSQHNSSHAEASCSCHPAAAAPAVQALARRARLHLLHVRQQHLGQGTRGAAALELHAAPLNTPSHRPVLWQPGGSTGLGRWGSQPAGGKPQADKLPTLPSSHRSIIPNAYYAAHFSSRHGWSRWTAMCSQRFCSCAS